MNAIVSIDEECIKPNTPGWTGVPATAVSSLQISCRVVRNDAESGVTLSIVREQADNACNGFVAITN